MSSAIPLRADLRECGSDLVSDWAILNDTKSRQLRRILATDHSRTDIEIEQACYLLESYHAVYRQNLMRLRVQGYRGKCPLPTTSQLQKIAKHLHRKTHQSYSPQQVMHELQAIAKRVKRLRQHGALAKRGVNLAAKRRSRKNYDSAALKTLIRMKVSQ
jgi:hypothetical protein